MSIFSQAGGKLAAIVFQHLGKRTVDPGRGGAKYIAGIVVHIPFFLQGDLVELAFFFMNVEDESMLFQSDQKEITGKLGTEVQIFNRVGNAGEFIQKPEVVFKAGEMIIRSLPILASEAMQDVAHCQLMPLEKALALQTGAGPAGIGGFKNRLDDIPEQVVDGSVKEINLTFPQPL